MQKQVNNQSILMQGEQNEVPIGKKIIGSLMSGQIQPAIQQKSQHIWTSVKITIGNLLVRGYRVFKYYIDQQCIIFIKKQQFNTLYMFFKLVEDAQQGLKPVFYRDIGYCVEQISKFKNKILNKYTVLLLYALDYCTLQINPCNQLLELFRIQTTGRVINKQQLCKIIPNNFYVQQTFGVAYGSPEINKTIKSEQIIIKQNEQQHKRLKEILYSYIDTFGQKFKTNFYKDLTLKSLYLINTLNVIIFEQTKPISCTLQSASSKLYQNYNKCTPIYNQIQSACWSSFKNGRLQSDRKDIVFTGNARILFIDLTFNYNINVYLSRQYTQQVEQLLQECKSSYIEGKVKIVKIQNSLTTRNVYSYHQKVVDQFSKVPVFSNNH